MRVRVLYFDGCPNRDSTIDVVRLAVGAARVGTAVETVEVRTAEEAIRLRFLGSPTVQIDGIDVDPAARARTDFSLACRLYGASGVPPAELIADAIREASATP